MKKNNKIFIITCLLFFISLAGGKLYFHEKWSSETIHNLEVTIAKNDEDIGNLLDKTQSLEAKLNQITNYYEHAIEYSEDSFNYLAIGNSITYHGTCDYWWNEGVGMAASSNTKDYVHLLADYLNKEIKKDVTTYSYNFYTWEVQSADRAETLTLLDGLLNEKLDLVTIQLGENASDISTFEADFIELIKYIKNASPKAQIIVLGEFWLDSNKDIAKKNACKTCEIPFVDLSEIQGVTEYQAGLGTIVYDADGNEHVIEHEGVAAHPGDKGMEWMAKATLNRFLEFYNPI